MGINDRLLLASHRSPFRRGETEEVVLSVELLKKISYIQWWDADKLEAAKPSTPCSSRDIEKQNEETYEILEDEMWQEYYRPFTLSSIQKIFSYGMNSTLQTFHSK